MMDYQELLERLRLWGLSSGLRIVLLLALTLVALRIVRTISQRICNLLARRRDDPEAARRVATLSSFLRYAAAVTIVSITSITILHELGVNIGPFLAGAGIVGLAVGFGAQNLVQDVISGFFILLENQIRVGDIVEVKGKTGTVERVGLRMTVLRDMSGNVHYIRNGHIDIVTNTTKHYSQVLSSIRLSYRADVAAVLNVLTEIDAELRGNPALQSYILQPLEVLGVEELAENAFVLRVRITTLPLKQGEVGREFNRLLKQKYDEQKLPLAVRIL